MSLGAKCNAVGEGPDAVDKGCKATDRGDVFAGACVVDLGCKAIAGGNVFSGARVVDRDHDFDTGDEGVEDWGIALPNEHSDETECPRLRLELSMGVQHTVDMSHETVDGGDVFAGIRVVDDGKVVDGDERAKG